MIGDYLRVAKKGVTFAQNNLSNRFLFKKKRRYYHRHIQGYNENRMTQIVASHNGFL